MDVETKVANQIIAIVNLMDVETKEYVIRNISLPEKPWSKEQKERIKQTTKEWDEQRGFYAQLYGYEWWNNGEQNIRLIKNVDVVPDGFIYKGRIKKEEKNERK